MKKDKRPILAICYDFDKTLSPYDMQAQGYIQSIEYEVDDFWKETNKLAADNDMDQNLAYMYMMATKSRGKVLFTRDKLKECGEKIELFPGVATWFDRINQYGADNGVIVEHYIISSGLKEMIEGTIIADKFKRIYASSFYFDDTGVAVWPAQAVNYTNKTQFLFRIEKGVLDVNDQKVNSYFAPDKIRVPFRNMVYIGDSETDIPCMKLVNANGGHSIGVYNPDIQDKTKVFRMLDENRIKYFSPADYSENSNLEILVKQIIDRTKANEALEMIHYDCLNEKLYETKDQTKEEQRREDLINDLADSVNFKNTHKVIEELRNYSDWTDAQIAKLKEIAITNNQLTYILSDDDIKSFYEELLHDDDTETADKIRRLMNS
ncbi:MAG: HAD family hydrolase [Acutalibacteraceae bacterium]